MERMILCSEILEHILQYADGETLLVCREVSPEFKESVDYLSRTKNIWKQVFLRDKEKYPYASVNKMHPHKIGFKHLKNWCLIYETALIANVLRKQPFVSTYSRTIGRVYSHILDIETHNGYIIVLMQYNKEFSIFQRLITLNLNNDVIHKSCRFYEDMLYITPIEDPKFARNGSIPLFCDSCRLAAIPVCVGENENGYPKFYKNIDYLTIEHSTGELIWINTWGKIITKGDCFHTGSSDGLERIKTKDAKCIKVFLDSTNMLITLGRSEKEFNTYKLLKGSVTCSFSYCDVLILGTDNGMVYAYYLRDEPDLEELRLDDYIWKYDVCSEYLKAINVMELRDEFVIICCTEKTVHRVHIRRKLRNLRRIF